MNSEILRVVRLHTLVLCMTCVAVGAGAARAGGLYVQELVDSYQGAANAGAQALGTDPSTVFHNPAAMSGLSGRQLSIGGGILLGEVKFSPSPTTPFPGGDGGNQASLAPLLGAYYTHQLNERFTFGAGLFSVSGAALDPYASWAGRFQLQEIELLTLTGMAALSYRINDEWTVGAGLGLTYGRLDFSLAVPAPLGGEGSINLDGDDIEPVGTIGIHYKPNDRLSIGFAAFSGFDMNFDGALTAQNAPVSFATDTGLSFAPTLRAGIAYETLENLTLLGSIGWEKWSALDNLYVSTASGTVPVPRNWDDTYHVSIGFRYQARDDLMLQAGMAYDSSPVDSTDRTADAPIDRQIRFSVGIEYKLRENMKVRGALTYADFGSADIRSSTLIGDYRKNDLLFVTLGLNYAL